jgi:hypothetical protein
MTVHFKWPMLLGLVICIGVGFSRCSTGALKGGEGIGDALNAGALWFSYMLAPALVAASVGAILSWHWRMKLEHPKQVARKSKDNDRLVFVNGPRSRKGNRQESALGKAARFFGKGMHDSGKKPTRPKGRVYAETTRPARAQIVEPEPASDLSLIEEIYETTRKMYHHKLTRQGFELVYRGDPAVNGQAWYAKYKAIWMQFGWVDVNRKGTMSWKYDEADLYRDLSERAWTRSRVRWNPPNEALGRAR